MSIRKLPDYRLRQKILYVDNTSPDTLIEYANLYFEAKDYSDALDFYSKAKYNQGIEKIKNLAIDTGDVMLFQRAAKAMDIEIKPIDWENIARRAAELKKYFFARHALEKTNNEGLLKSLIKTMKAEEPDKTA